MQLLRTVFFLLLFLPFRSFGQHNRSYILADCTDSLIIAELFWCDTVTSRQINEPFVLKNHLSWLSTPFPYQPQKWSVGNLNKDVLICLTNEQRDSVLAQPSLVYWYPVYGLIDISYFECLNENARRYGFRPNAMGCVNDGEYDAYLKMIDRILERRNGVFWHDRIEEDINACLLVNQKKE